MNVIICDHGNQAFVDAEIMRCLEGGREVISELKFVISKYVVVN